jgi:hypothetical protein
VTQAISDLQRVERSEHSSPCERLQRKKDDDIGEGTTARAYGVRGYPTAFLIDQSGKIAFRSDDPTVQPELEALSKKFSIKLGINLDSTLTEEHSRQLRAAVLGEVIERVLAQL